MCTCSQTFSSYVHSTVLCTFPAISIGAYSYISYKQSGKYDYNSCWFPVLHQLSKFGTFVIPKSSTPKTHTSCAFSQLAMYDCHNHHHSHPLFNTITVFPTCWHSSSNVKSSILALPRRIMTTNTTHFTQHANHPHGSQDKQYQQTIATIYAFPSPTLTITVYQQLHNNMQVTIHMYCNDLARHGTQISMSVTTQYNYIIHL